MPRGGRRGATWEGFSGPLVAQALRDLLAGNYGVDEAREVEASKSGWSLYPDGFSAERFAEVIETEAVWDVRTATRGSRGVQSTDYQDDACRK